MSEPQVRDLGRGSKQLSSKEKHFEHYERQFTARHVGG